MDAISAYSFTSCAWHLLQAIPLIIWPAAINGLLTYAGEQGAVPVPSMPMQPSSSVENYFARSLGLALLALGMVTVVLTGSLPLGSMVESPTETPSPYAAASVLLTTLHHVSAAFYCWARYNKTQQTGFLLGFVGSAVLAAFGTWCVLFGGGKARVSRRTGADKRTSGFPFRNAEAEKRKGR
ncbi:Uu.00g010790.m01.CDS01 [Anthostomella pinea]|uniref:Uu.00g010790.m01.CDS01 n=1 Tax=Anthostomella pinea TaxID=933095 RepID=A0AAI8VYI9_9PEZI|nr:Uu.00g010790.m01.CDS01 [Anthostomella pinea]